MLAGLPATRANCRQDLCGCGSVRNDEVVFDLRHAGSAPRGGTGLASLGPGRDRAGEGDLAAIGLHRNVCGIDFGVTLERVLDGVLDRIWLDGWFKG